MHLVTPRTERRPVYRDDVACRHDPVLAGYQLERWDGSSDAVVCAPPVRLSLICGVPFQLEGLSARERELLEHGVSGGAFQTVSGMYAANITDVFDATQAAFDYLTNAHKIAMFTNSIGTMSYYTDTSFGSAPYTSNEVSGTGYTAGGYTLANKAMAQSPNGTVQFDNTVDPNWTITGSFSVAARGAVVYSTTTPSNWLFLAIAFGSDFNVTNGTFTIQLASAGLATIQAAA